ncbi:hypothetical protein J3Q64DRAFT_1694331 [Phycomyces blakesleeanus]|uniref:Uncharacterized protein n=2 Tax=Phycomyces blakesleeanus TaxID=4837 RepID=A0A167QIX6_PHYB8|nr:hypothetical protein PHYBLDRAFT_58816 [Phycomyces blakesleeanus NRRL 1555(-)]OAD79769.1 hypothetical protein PHYBLDRAFT_58816 [Phycomyces blakesleeanus NRRL 1555(-)]|eukprot:XP_018297809.1 hypothetical protein PHYBLDRAFT_58816 [Phycomyces blakesleeanus NRRL 1555(-)]
MNEIYSVEPVLGDIYILKGMSLSDIFTEMLKHFTYFNNKTVSALLRKKLSEVFIIKSRFLRMMVDRLRSRPFIDKGLVAQSSFANEPFDKCDINDDVLEGTDGPTRDNTQYKLKMNLNQYDILLFRSFGLFELFRNANNSGYFGLHWSLNKCRGPKGIFKVNSKDHKNVKKIVVDRFSINAEIEVSARETLVLDQVIINKLEYRRRPVQIFL